MEDPFTVLPNGVDGKRIPGAEEQLSHGVGAFLPWGASAACSLDEAEDCDARMVRTFPNTNLMAPLCAVPTLCATLEPGELLLVHAFFGSVSGNARPAFDAAPRAELGQEIKILRPDGRTVSIHQSWGINRDHAAELRLDFGRPVRLDELRLTLRADFPHDSYWTSATVEFSDGTREVLSLCKSAAHQCFPISVRTVEWLVLKELIKAEDESPFPALTQLEAWGTEA